MKLLITGTRKPKGFRNEYHSIVDNALTNRCFANPDEELELIEGCCSDSADEFAEIWAKEQDVKVNHRPANNGKYLKRNIEMVDECEEVLAFWDGWSYGTAHTIATALMRDKKVKIIELKKVV